MKTQQFKSISLREMVNAALSGRPINNCNVHQLYDIDDCDLDDDKYIADEYSDELTVLGHFIQNRENQIANERNNNSNDLKGGISDENSKEKTDETPPSLSQE